MILFLLKSVSIVGLVRFASLAFVYNSVKTNEWTVSDEIFAMTLVSGSIRFMRICARVLARGVVNAE